MARAKAPWARSNIFARWSNIFIHNTLQRFARVLCSLNHSLRTLASARRQRAVLPRASVVDLPGVGADGQRALATMPELRRILPGVNPFGRNQVSYQRANVSAWGRRRSPAGPSEQAGKCCIRHKAPTYLLARVVLVLLVLVLVPTGLVHGLVFLLVCSFVHFDWHCLWVRPRRRSRCRCHVPRLSLTV